jgi:opacity protein-like surface antigen
MKKYVCLIALMAFVMPSIAQEVRYGLKAGTNIGSLRLVYDGETENFDNKISYYAGARAELGLAEKLSIQGELLYQVYGGDWVEGRYKMGITLHEASVPLVVKYYLVSQKLSINGGISASYIFFSKVEWYVNDDLEETENGNKYFRPIDMGISLGAEYRLTDSFFVDLRYNLGLSNISKYPNDETVNTRAFQLGVGFRF